MTRLIDADAISYVESEDGVLEDYAFRYDINELPTIIPAEEVYKRNYCPNCGAKMDKEKE